MSRFVQMQCHAVLPGTCPLRACWPGADTRDLPFAPGVSQRVHVFTCGAVTAVAVAGRVEDLAGCSSLTSICVLRADTAASCYEDEEL